MFFLLFLVEFTDMLDGIIARRGRKISDVGKLLDPFADVFFHLTCFFCFQVSGIIPLWVFLVILWRELGMTFLRMLLVKKEIVLAARWWGKGKSFLYFIFCVAGIMVLGGRAWNLEGTEIFEAVVFHLSNFVALVALLSFQPYLNFLIRLMRQN